jgi:tetratricopeptide (TPR) repeat protein
MFREPAITKGVAIMGRPGAMQSILLCGLMLLVFGCATSQPINMERSQAAYASGDYATAYREAAIVADDVRAPAAQRQESAYLAGVSAYNLDKFHDAQRYFEQAARSSDADLAGDASAMLGLVHARLGRHALAARTLLEAAPKMQGQDRANAYFYAGVAQQRLGMFPESRTSLSLARSASSDPAFRQRASEQMGVTGYTLQVGAFSQEANARRTAETMAEQARDKQLGVPRVVPATGPDGKSLYLVQIGQFYSWPTAMAARNRIASTAAIIVPLDR